MKVLLYGHLGWIGSQLVEILEEMNITYKGGISRVDHVDNVRKEIDDYQPTHVVSFIGRTSGKTKDKVYTTIDYLEQDGKLYENIRDNLYSPLILTLLCHERNIHFTYLGTGCIFTYDENHPFGEEVDGFTEESTPNFFGSSYSTVKGFTDQLMKLFSDSVLNVRIRMPINDQQNVRNFITKITTYEKICSIPNSMTVLPELLPFVVDMMKNNHTGTINLTNPGLISHDEILTMFQNIVDPTFTWRNFSLEEQRQILDGDRSNNFLETTKLEKLYPQVLPIKKSVEKMLIQYRQNYTPVPKKQPIERENVDFDFEIQRIKTLFITGGAGFIGSNFINYFCKKYPFVKVINFDSLYYCGKENNIDPLIRNSRYYQFINGNLQSYDLLKYIFQSHEISHVIHFAAQSHVQHSFEDSLQYTNDNVVGTHNLLEINRKYNNFLLRFIHVSTDEVYGESMINIEEQHKTEHSILCPTNPYAATKAAAELIAQSYSHSFSMPIIITRGNNVYGQNQYPEKLIPRFIDQLKQNKKVTIQGDGSCIRAFLHAFDTSTAFEHILCKGTIGEIYNIGCDEGMEYSVKDVSKILIRIIQKTDSYEDWIEYVDDRPYNDKRYYISNEKLKALGWRISVHFLDGLHDLISSYDKNHSHEKK